MDSIVKAAKDASIREFLPTKSLGDLVVGSTYPILTMHNVTTKYGTYVVCDLQDPQDMDDQFSVFLPKRYEGIYREDQLAALVPGKLGLTVIQHIQLATGNKTYQIDINYRNCGEMSKKKKKNQH